MSQRLPAVRPKEVIRAMCKAGFFVHHTSGSHYVLKHSGKPHLRVTIPYHNRDLKRKTLSSIIDQAGLTPAEFVELL